MMTILITSRWNTFLDCSILVKTCKLLPHTHMGESLLWEGLHISMNLLVEDLQTAPPYSYARASSLGMFSFIHDHPKDGKLQAYDLFDMAHLDLALHFFIRQNISTIIRCFHYYVSTSFFIMLMSWRYILELTPSLSSRHTCYMINTVDVGGTTA